MKKLFTLTICVVMLICAGIFLSSCKENSSYELGYRLNDDDTFSVSEYKGTIYDLVIPDYFQGKPVTRISENVFTDNYDIRTISFGKNIEFVGFNAFGGLKNLEGVYINDLSKWCNIVFNDPYSGCSHMQNPLRFAGKLYLNNRLITELIIPDDVETIKDGVFSGARCVNKAIMGKNVKSVGFNAFAGCYNLFTVELNKGLREIDREAFVYCFRLVEIYNFASMDLIENNFFNYYKVHQNYEPSIVNYSRDGFVYVARPYGNELLAYIGNNIDIYIPDYITSMHEHVFMYNEELNSVALNNNISEIGSSAFYWCRFLTRVTIGSNVKNIKNCAFNVCPALVEVCNNSVLRIEKGTGSNGSVGLNAKDIFNGNKPSNVSIDNMGFITYRGNDAIYLIGYRGKETKITVPENVRINDNCFQYGKMIEVVIPDSVEVIGKNALDHCNYLTKVTVGNGIIKISAGAFEYCGELKTLVLGKNITNIHLDAFYGCNKLEKIYFKGSSNKWDIMYVEKGNLSASNIKNSPFYKAEVYFYSEETPANREKLYWHYDENNNIVEWKI